MSARTTWTYGATYYFTSVPVWTSGEGLSYLLYVPTNGAGTLVRWIIYWNDADNTVYLEVRSNSAVVSTIAGPTMTNSDMINAAITVWVSAKQNGYTINTTLSYKMLTAMKGVATRNQFVELRSHDAYLRDLVGFDDEDDVARLEGLARLDAPSAA